MSAHALLLAAGEGTRLRPHTATKPKCMVELAGAPLLDHQLEALRAAGIDAITVVTGYRSDAFADRAFDTRHNDRFASTNMVASLMVARDLFDGTRDILVSYADIVYEPDIVRALLAAPAALATTVDRHWRSLWELRMDDPLADAETLRIDAAGNISDIGRRAGSFDEVEAQYMGLVLIRSSIAVAVLDLYDSLDPDGEFEGRSRDQMYMTTFLQLLMAQVAPLHAVVVEGGWLEVDSVDDLATYERLAATGDLDSRWRRGGRT